MAAHLPASPIDFRNAARFERGSDEQAIAKTLNEGISIDHPLPEQHLTHHELLMPKFDHLSSMERRSIALYVISLRSDESQRSQ